MCLHHCMPPGIARAPCSNPLSTKCPAPEEHTTSVINRYRQAAEDIRGTGTVGQRSCIPTCGGRSDSRVMACEHAASRPYPCVGRGALDKASGRWRPCKTDSNSRASGKGVSPCPHARQDEAVGTRGGESESMGVRWEKGEA